MNRPSLTLYQSASAVLSIGLCMSSAFAQNTSTTSSSGLLNPPSSVQSHSQISLFSESFISPDYGSNAGNNFGFVGANYQRLSENSDEIGLRADVSGAFAPQQSTMSFFNVSQLYFEGWGVEIGRKKNDWSLLDEQWRLGFFQPQFQWNPLLPDSQGLTGFFINLKNQDKAKPMGIRVFGSFLFVPNQGPGYQISGGKFQSVNPWFQEMPSQLQFGNSGTVVNQLNWSIQTPETTSILFNPSYAMQAYYGQEKQGLYLSAAAGYLPSNQLLLAVNSATLPTPQTNINIYPEFYYHTLGALDIRYSAQSIYFGLSALTSKPSSAEEMPAGLNYRVYNSRQIYSPTVGVSNLSFDASISYLDIEGQSDPVTGPQSQILSNYLPQQLGYGNAYQAKVSYVFGSGGKSLLPGLKLSSAYLMGAKDDFAMWNTGAHYRVNRQWSMDGTVLMVRANATSTTASLFQQYENNDMVNLGVNYDF